MRILLFLVPTLLFGISKDLPLDSYVTKNAWERIGLHDHYGIDITLLGLVSKNSSGNGEFLDLLPLIDFLATNGFDILQLLPLNDTGDGTSPYSPISSHALSPIFLSLEFLPYLNEAPKSLIEELYELKKYNKTPRVEYHKVLKLKNAWLEKYLEFFGKKIETHPNYKAFLAQSSSWLSSYALFKAFRKKYGYNINKWPKRLQDVSDDQIVLLEKEYKEIIRFFQLIQFLCQQQLSFVHKYANNKGVFLLGDMPFMLDVNSVEIWRYPDLFKLAFSEGTPPGAITPKGEYWSLPPYNWERIEQTNYQFFRQRLETMSQYYDIFRIDHTSGFFSQFEIPKGHPPKDGKRVPSSQKELLAAGKKHLSAIASFTQMLPTAEDLLFTPEMHEVIIQLGIPGIRLFAYINTKAPVDKLILNGNHYNRMTITGFADHDFPPFRTWWEEHPDRAEAFAKEIGWIYQKTPTLKQQEELMWLDMHSNSLLHIELLQDLLPPNLTHPPKNERINTPGTVNSINWTYRYKLTIEELTTNTEITNLFKTVLSPTSPVNRSNNKLIPTASHFN